MIRYPLLVFTICSLVCLSVVSAQDQKEQSVKGKIEKIMPEENTIILSGKEFFIAPELIEYAYLEEGDSVELIVAQTVNGQEVIDYFYMFDEDDTPAEYPDVPMDDFTVSE